VHGSAPENVSQPLTHVQSNIARLGVTGGIGSGKSTVCALFAQLGVTVYSADDIAREIVDSQPHVRTAIIQLLGPESYQTDGTLHRPYVASRIFARPSLQRRLNAIVHPEVERELDRRIRQYNGRIPFVMVEAALIYEAGLDRMLDAVIVVDASESVRIRRVVARDHLKAEEVRRRMNVQWSQQKKIQRADYLIRNNGSLVELATNVKFLYTVFLQRYR
jgi:dephospho-CoA kinase